MYRIPKRVLEGSILSLNADVPHTWAAPTGGPPVSLFR